MDAVREVLSEIDAEQIPQLIVFNKADLSPEVKTLVDHHPGSVAVSAVTGEGIDDLLAAIGDQLRAMTEVYELFVPWARGDILAAAHREGEVLTETTEDDGMRILARFEPASAKRLGEFLVRKVDN
jgi:GTP-binding protein HflX